MYNLQLKYNHILPINQSCMHPIMRVCMHPIMRVSVRPSLIKANKMGIQNKLIRCSSASLTLDC
uniref:Uncharacterized protein n=1 Tax=Rhizophora mucronata TaxID=61149 RepID=A0A2P2N8E3_RHIMU